MTQPNDMGEQLSAYLDGELSNEQAAAVERAIEADAALMRELASLRTARRLVHSLPRHKAPEDFVTRVVQRAERARLVNASGAAEPAGARLWRGLAVAASLLIAVGITTVIAVSVLNSPRGTIPGPPDGLDGGRVAGIPQGGNRSGGAGGGGHAPGDETAGPDWDDRNTDGILDGSILAMAPISQVDVYTPDVVSTNGMIEQVLASNDILPAKAAVHARARRSPTRGKAGGEEAVSEGFYESSAENGNQIIVAYVPAEQADEIAQQVRQIAKQQTVSQKRSQSKKDLYRQNAVAEKLIQRQESLVLRKGKWGRRGRATNAPRLEGDGTGGKGVGEKDAAVAEGGLTAGKMLDGQYGRERMAKAIAAAPAERAHAGRDLKLSETTPAVPVAAAAVDQPKAAPSSKPARPDSRDLPYTLGAPGRTRGVTTARARPAPESMTRPAASMPTRMCCGIGAAATADVGHAKEIAGLLSEAAKKNEKKGDAADKESDLGEAEGRAMRAIVIIVNHRRPMAALEPATSTPSTTPP